MHKSQNIQAYKCAYVMQICFGTYHTFRDLLTYIRDLFKYNRELFICIRDLFKYYQDLFICIRDLFVNIIKTYLTYWYDLFADGEPEEAIENSRVGLE